MISDLPQGIFSLVVAFSNRLAPLSHWKSERKTGTRVCATLRTWLSGWVQFMAVENSCRFRTWGPGVGRRRHVQKKERKKKATEKERNGSMSHDFTLLSHSRLSRAKHKTCTRPFLYAFSTASTSKSRRGLSLSLSLSNYLEFSDKFFFFSHDCLFVCFQSIITDINMCVSLCICRTCWNQSERKPCCFFYWTWN